MKCGLVWLVVCGDSVVSVAYTMVQEVWFAILWCGVVGVVFWKGVACDVVGVSFYVVSKSISLWCGGLGCVVSHMAYGMSFTPCGRT